MSPVQRAVFDALQRLGGHGTAAQIAKETGRSSHSVSTTLCWLRGAGVVRQAHGGWILR